VTFGALQYLSFVQRERKMFSLSEDDGKCGHSPLIRALYISYFHIYFPSCFVVFVFDYLYFPFVSFILSPYRFLDYCKVHLHVSGLHWVGRCAI
jgi:hypothetical protein